MLLADESRKNEENATRLAEESRKNEQIAKRLAEEERRTRLEAQAEIHELRERFGLQGRA
jgi:membrane protein involved in colicin uptake